MKRRYIIAAALLLASCSNQGNPNTPNIQSNPSTLAGGTPALHPTTETAKASLSLTGTVVAAPSQTCRLVAPLDGRVEGLRVGVGDHVATGQRLATLNGHAAADHHIRLRQAESDFHLADRDLKIKQSLFDDGMVSERELTEAQERYHMAETALSQLTSVATGDIVSPMRGTVLQRPVTNGQYVQAGELLLEISDISTVQVLADVYESDISRVRMGDSVIVTTLARPDESFSGTIDKVYSALDPDSKTMKVRITLPNPDRHLLPGMFATITLVP